MKRALVEARKGLGLTAPNPAVGAVLVWQNTIIGKGWHKGVGQAHAEIEAISDAVSRGHLGKLSTASLYVTLEPCSTQGRTPPCCSAILERRIPKVVVGCRDPDARHRGAGLEFLSSQGVEVCVGVEENRCREIIRGFRMRVTQGRPYVIGKVGVTLDGKTQIPAAEGRWITGDSSREDVQRLRSEVDGICVGGATIRADDPFLNLRGRWRKRRPLGLKRIVLSDAGNIPSTAKVFLEDGCGAPLYFRGRKLKEVMQDLGTRGLNTILVESGGTLLKALYLEGLLDELVVYYAPVMGGGPASFFDLPGRLHHWPVSEWKSFGSDMRFRGWRGSTKKAVFFDRDGVVNASPGAGYVLSWDQFIFNPGIIAAIKVAKDSGYLVGLLTSQRGVEKGEMSFGELEDLHHRMQTVLSESGAAFDGIFAYTGPGCGFPNKPSPEMLNHAARNLDVNPDGCWMIGDADRDIAMAQSAGVKGTIRILSEHPVGLAADHVLSGTAELAELLRLVL